MKRGLKLWLALLLSAALLLGGMAAMAAELEPETVFEEPVEGLEMVDEGDGLPEEIMEFELPEGMAAVESDSGIVSNDYDPDFSIGSDGALYGYHGAGGDVVIPDGVTEIWGKAFADCTSLKSVTIPKSVTIIWDSTFSAFSGCTGLTDIIVQDGNQNYSSYDGILYNADTTEPIYCPQGKTSVTILSGVTSIAGGAFHDCTSLKSIVIPDGVTKIGSYAFSGCTSLESVTIPSGVTSIEHRAFTGCTSLTSVTIPSGVKYIDDGVFYKCTSLTSVTIPSGVTSIGMRAFYNCTSLKSIVIPASVTSIGSQVFNNCKNLEKVYFCSGEIKSNIEGIHGKKTTIYAPANSSVAKSFRGNKLEDVLPVEKSGSYKMTLGDDRKQILLPDSLPEACQSDNEAVATVTKKGMLKVKGAGSARITVTKKDGKNLVLTLKVADPAALSQKSLKISVVDSATIQLNGGFNRKVTWSSDNAEVVKIVKKDKTSATIKGVKKGTATIKAEVKGGKTLKCKVTVVNPLTIKVRGINEASLYNKLKLSFINNSDKKIASVKFDVTEYNKKGKKSKSQFSYSEAIEAHSSMEDDYLVDNDTQKVKITITKVTFSDKTKWQP